MTRDADPDLVRPGDFLAGSGAQAAQELFDLARPPTAIIASSDAEALGVMEVARERGIDVPGEVSLIGFDDIPEARYMNPGLTTVRQPMGDMGRTAAEILIDAMAGDAMPVASIELPTELIVRGTTGPAIS